MATFSRKKALKRRFYRLRLSESDLARLARKVQAVATDLGQQIQITVIGADLEDAFSTQDPAFFESENMPASVGRITIGFSRYDSPLSCSIELPSLYDGPCTLEVEGTDSDRATGLFGDLEQELASRAAGGAWLASRARSLGAALVFSGLTALAVYSLFDLLARIVIVAGAAPTSSLPRVIVTIAWLAVAATFAFAPSAFGDAVRAALPPVEFTGRIRERGSARRTSLRTWMLIVLLPIILNVFASLVSDALRR